MANNAGGAVREGLRTLWSVGTLTGSEDRALIERFLESRDASAEEAFRLLVERHAPMVVRVCRQVLGDEHLALDAAQAVFLVLARKAGSIRSRNSIAPWLHGVARRVAARARRREGTRRLNETQSAEVVARVEAMEVNREDWSAIHEEIGRLPEKYRGPVVLCYLEGQSYDQAANRIGCPVGTIRVRLSRARDKLRDQLTRRGFAPAIVAAVGEFADAPTLGSLPSGWVESTVKASLIFASGRAAMVGMVSASVLALSEGVLRTMFTIQLKLAAVGLVTAGVLATGAGVIVGNGDSQAPNSSAPAGTEKEDAPPVVKPSEAQLAEKILASAKRRLDAQKTFYDEGRITIDRYLDALDLYKKARVSVSPTEAERINAIVDYRDRVEEVFKREKAEQEIGRSTAADVSEAEHRLDCAELEAMKARAPFSGGESVEPLDEAKLVEEILDSARTRLDASRSGFEQGSMDLSLYSMRLEEFKKIRSSVAKTQEERLAAIVEYRDRLQELAATQRKKKREAESPDPSLSDAAKAALKAEYRRYEGAELFLESANTDLLRFIRANSGNQDEPLKKRVDDLEKQVERLSKLLELSGVMAPEQQKKANRR